MVYFCVGKFPKQIGMVARRRRFNTRRHMSASGILTTIWVASVIVNGKNSDQRGAYPPYKFHVEFRSDNILEKNNSDAFILSTQGTTEVPYLNAGLGSAPGNHTNATLEVKERFLANLAVSLFKTAVSFVAELWVKEPQGEHTCYRNVCFTPANGLGLSVGGPKMPQEENTTFIFYDNNHLSGQEVNETTWETFLDNYTGNISKPLVAVVHGLNGSRESPWARKLIDALLEKVNCNVLQVDWQERARFPNYAKAASSAPLVGVLLSFMLQKMIQTSNCSLHPDNVHIVGFSLGAHAAGVCGRHFFNTTEFTLGRITGLDPAGPLFVESNVSLSKTDAQFVDVIHTNAGDFAAGKFGLNKAIGHVDFYPNGGSDQPNCSLSKDPGCSHKRAQDLFIYSVLHTCSLKSYYCKNGWRSFLSGECLNITNASYIGEMGYHSIDAPGRGKQYLNTTGAPPYCYNNTEQWNSLLKKLATEKRPEEGDDQTVAVTNQLQQTQNMDSKSEESDVDSLNGHNMLA